jgi:xanthine/CO dehydrogenase XdhC/CoxF family maturation factor
VAALQGALAQGSPTSATLPVGTGEVDLLIEPILPAFALWIFGAGEHAQPLARLAKELGWFLGIVDHRPALATPERFPEADRIVLGHPPASLEGLPLDGRSAALVVSHVYDKDLQAMAALIQKPLAYLGLQGNRLRCAKLLKELQDEGLVLTEAQRQIIHFPAGLDLGGESPEAIALSMLAEIQATFAQRTGGSLRDKSGSIHGADPASRPTSLPS